MEHAYWGPEFSERALQEALNASRVELDRQDGTVQRLANEEVLCSRTAERLAEGKIVGRPAEALDCFLRTQMDVLV